jgi:phosphoribosylanthranilate isomerase
MCRLGDLTIPDPARLSYIVADGSESASPRPRHRSQAFGSAGIDVFIKICGMTSAAAVVAAVECGVDAIGFVFAPSVRRVTPAQAAEWSQQAPEGLLRVAVTQHPGQSLLDEILAVLEPDVLQTDHEDLADLRMPDELRVLPVVRAGGIAPSALPVRLLFEGPGSGRGKPSDWAIARELALRTQVILAGGLTAANVGAAIAQVRPFGVDVSSGVESAPGVKDARRMAEFVTAVRKAAKELETLQ